MSEELNWFLKEVERFKVNILRYEQYDLYIGQNFVEKDKSKAKPYIIDDYYVFQFQYDGSMPLYDQKDRHYQSIIKDYYAQATYNMYNFGTVDMKFEKAVMIIQHFFPDRVIRDLDNRNRKYLIDAIRHTGLIKNDDFQHLSIFEEGIITDEEPYVNVFLLEEKNFADFIKYKKDLGTGRQKDLSAIATATMEEINADYEQKMAKKKRALDALDDSLF